MDGVDHIYAQPRTPAILDIVNARLGDRVEAQHSTLPDFLAAVRNVAPELQTVRGELRHSNRTWRLQALLAHVASSRIHLKQQNHRCETLLERWAEPFSALAWLHGADYPAAYLRYAWKQLLLNHPHDSLCGCSIDQVHRDMLPRFEQCRQVGEELVQNALDFFANRIVTNTTTASGEHAPHAALVVFNPLGWARHEVVETLVELPQETAPNAVQIVDGNGVVISCALESLPTAGHLHQPPYDIPHTIRCKRWRVRFAADTPPFGYTT
jgi:alpha-mannosidase/mannosylglycerate hydrolase